MDEELNLVNRVNDLVNEIKELKKDNEMRTTALATKIKNLENQNNWKFLNISQETKALICFSITALFAALTFGLLHSFDINSKNGTVNSPKKIMVTSFCTINSLVWWFYSFSQLPER